MRGRERVPSVCGLARVFVAAARALFARRLQCDPMTPAAVVFVVASAAVAVGRRGPAHSIFDLQEFFRPAFSRRCSRRFLTYCLCPVAADRAADCSWAELAEFLPGVF